MKSAVATIIATMVALNFSPTIAKEYDDPAVAVCEYTKLHGKAHPKSVYERLNARIDGLVVTITFQKSPLNTKPKTATYSCEFVSKNEKFELAIPIIKNHSRCVDWSERYLEEAKKKTDAAKMSGNKKAAINFVAANKKTADMCRSVFQEVQNVMNQHAIDILKLATAGIYPIKPEDTVLLSLAND